MKEKIYTIPVNEAYDSDCECPLCLLEKKLERETLDYTLGAAMMEPDFRERSNKKGFCNHHFSMLFDMPNKLPLALILETHLDEIRKKTDKMSKLSDKLTLSKSGFFKKSGSADFASALSSLLAQISYSCIVCDKINHTMERYADVLLYMWINDEEFKKKFDRSKGFCLKHMKLLCDTAPKSLNDAQAAQFLFAMFTKQRTELDRIQKNIHKFTLKFDYRNKDMEWGSAQDAPIRTIEKISGYIKNDYEENK
ncbi:MAG: ABC transporter substrate-binding protein [Clostridia bacterium]|nr:ABC transporter substrate-binding protein [Clostridia bacterium]